METVLVEFYMLWAGVEICYYGSKCYRYGWFGFECYKYLWKLGWLGFECYRQVWKPAAMAPNVIGVCGKYGFRFCSSCRNTAVVAPSHASGCIHDRFSSLVVFLFLWVKHSPSERSGGQLVRATIP